MKSNQLKIGMLLSYANTLIGNLIPLFYTPIMLELLGQSEYGLYKLAASAASYLSLISFGIGMAVSRYLIKERVEKGVEAERRLFGLFDLIFQIIAVVTCIAGCVIALNLHHFYEQSLTAYELHRMKILVIILSVNTAIGFSTFAYTALVTSREKFIVLQAINVLTTCVTPLANLVALYMGFASVGLTFSTLLISVIVRILYLLYVHKGLKIRPCYRNMPIKLLREILVFSFWIFLGNVVAQLYNATDTMIIGAIPTLATVGVAVYNVGGVFNHMIFSLAQAVSFLFAPHANKLVFSGAGNEELTDFAIRIGRYQCLVIALACSGFIAFGKAFITWYVGAEYLDAYWVALLMMIPSCIPLVQSVALNIMQAENKHQFRSIVYLIIAVINVVGTYLAVQSHGIIGAAFVTGAATVLGQGMLMNWYYWKRIGLNIPRFWKNILPILWIPALLCGITLFLGTYIDFTNIIAFFCGVAVYTAVYCILLWLFVLQPGEKAQIQQSITRKLAKQ